MVEHWSSECPSRGFPAAAANPSSWITRVTDGCYGTTISPTPLSSTQRNWFLTSDGGRYVLTENLKEPPTEPALEANEGCWINVREGSVTLLSRHWQLAAPCPILLNHPTLI